MDIAAFETVDTAECTGAQAARGRVQAEQSSGPGGQPVGVNVFVAEAGACALSNPLNSQDSNFVVYHKKFPGLITPFDLPIECFPDYERMLDEDPGAVDAVNIMIRGAVASSTADNYKYVVNRFHGFCAERGYTFPKFETGAVLRLGRKFICYTIESSFIFYSIIRPVKRYILL